MSRAGLADRLALAIVEHGPSSGSRLADVLRARKSAVLAVLKADPRFESLGRGRGSRWLFVGNRIRPPWEPMGTDPVDGLGESLGLTDGERLSALESRVADLERQLAGLGATAR